MTSHRSRSWTRILLLGSRGQVGRAISERFDAKSLLHAPAGFDITDAPGLTKLLRDLRPELVINCAAYTQVDQAEKDRQRAHAVNAEAPRHLARLCHEHHAYLVHYSTDYVYGATGSEPIREDAKPQPLQYYGWTKWEGDQAIADQLPDRHMILRVSWVYAAGGKNFPSAILRRAQSQDLLQVVHDQWGSPTSARMIADATFAAVHHEVWQPGTYHCVARGFGTWYDFAREVVDRAQSLGYTLQVRSLVAVPSSEYPLPAPRPTNSRLDTSRFRDAFAYIFPSWQDVWKREAPILCQSVLPAQEVSEGATKKDP